MTLLSLKKGQKAKICELKGDPSLIDRLRVMGISSGEEIRLVGSAPLKDPLIVKTLDTVLALRLNEAQAITVTPCGE